MTGSTLIPENGLDRPIEVKDALAAAGCDNPMYSGFARSGSVL